MCHNLGQKQTLGHPSLFYYCSPATMPIPAEKCSYESQPRPSNHQFVGHFPVLIFDFTTFHTVDHPLLFGLFQFVHFNLLGFGCKDKRGCYESSRNSFQTSLSLAATPAILFEALRWPLGLHGLQCKGSGPGAVHLLSGLSSQAPADSCPVGMREAQCGLPSQGPREAGIMYF